MTLHTLIGLMTVNKGIRVILLWLEWKMEHSKLITELKGLWVYDGGCFSK
jgi:hypothetical protein